MCLSVKTIDDVAIEGIVRSSTSTWYQVNDGIEDLINIVDHKKDGHMSSK